MSKQLKTAHYAMMAVMIALYIILSLMVIEIGGLKMTLEHFPMIVCAVIYGPVEAMIVGGLGELINQLTAFGFTPTTILWILPIIMRGLIVGGCRNLFIGKMKPDAMMKNKFSVVFGSICILSGIISSLLNTAALYVDSKIFGYYSFALVFGALAARIILSIITSIVIVIAIKPILHALHHARLIEL